MHSTAEVLYLSRQDVEELAFPMVDVIQAVEKAFFERGEGRTEAPPKPGIHPKRDAFIHAMPAYIPKLKCAGIKWVSGFPENHKLGLPYITGLIMLNDVETGLPISIMDCTWITAKRTGAATAVAAKYLATQDSTILGILGCGVQGRSNLEALALAFPFLETIKAYDINKRNLQLYVEEMKARYDLEFFPVSSPREAVEDCDIVVTAGPILKNPRPVIEKAWFKEGGFACPLDFDSYWKPETMHSMDKFCTDDRDQMYHYKKAGYFSNTPDVYAELGEIVSGRKPGRESPQERTMSMNLGLAIEDVATAIRIYKKAVEAGAGRKLPL